jgi:hypothetical protein
MLGAFSDGRTGVLSSGPVPVPDLPPTWRLLVGPRERGYKRPLIGGPVSGFGGLRVMRWLASPHQAPDLAHGEPCPGGDGGFGLTWCQPDCSLRTARVDALPEAQSTNMPPAEVGGRCQRRAKWGTRTTDFTEEHGPFSFKQAHRTVREETNRRTKAKEATAESIKKSHKHDEPKKKSDDDRPPKRVE